jgi:hypothetical protein
LLVAGYIAMYATLASRDVVRFLGRIIMRCFLDVHIAVINKIILFADCVFDVFVQFSCQIILVEWSSKL